MEENYIDVREMQEQRKREIIKSGKYCLAEIVIGKDEKFPVIHIEVEKVTSKEIGQLIAAMKGAINEISKVDPIAYEYSKQIKAKMNSFITEEKGEGENA